MRPDPAALIIEGVRRFNRREFWAAHESWETIWLACESEAREFLRGLIQLTAALHHLGRGNVRGAHRLLRESQRRLRSYPVDYCGMNVDEIRSAAAALAMKLADTPNGIPYDAVPPRILLADGWRDRLPKFYIEG